MVAEGESAVELAARVLEAAQARTDLVWTTEWDSAYGSEVDQIRAALDWSSSPTGDPPLALALTVAALPLWGHLGLGEECLARVDHILALPGLQPTPEELIALEAARAGALVNRDRTGTLVTETWRRISHFEGQVDAPQQKLQVLLAELGGAWMGDAFATVLRLANACATLQRQRAKRPTLGLESG